MPGIGIDVVLIAKEAFAVRRHLHYVEKLFKRMRAGSAPLDECLAEQRREALAGCYHSNRLLSAYTATRPINTISRPPAATMISNDPANERVSFYTVSAKKHRAIGFAGN